MKPLSKPVDLEALAADTSCFSGASLENLLNEAAIAAAGRGAETIEPDVRGAFFKTVAGADPQEHGDARGTRVIAVHEAGTRSPSILLTPENRLKRVSILPAGGGALDTTSPFRRSARCSKRQIEAQISVLLAGARAELLAAARTR